MTPADVMVPPTSIIARVSIHSKIRALLCRHMIHIWRNVVPTPKRFMTTKKKSK